MKIILKKIRIEYEIHSTQYIDEIKRLEELISSYKNKLENLNDINNKKFK